MKYLLALAALIPNASLALSCGFAPMSEAYAQAQRQGDNIVIVRGRFDFPMPGLLFEEQDFRLQATFLGNAIGEDLTETPMFAEVTVSGNCINGDCGYLEPGEQMIAFLHTERHGYVTYSLPCASFPVRADAAPIADLMACWTGGDCTALEVDR